MKKKKIQTAKEFNLLCYKVDFFMMCLEAITAQAYI